MAGRPVGFVYAFRYKAMAFGIDFIISDPTFWLATLSPHQQAPTRAQVMLATSPVTGLISARTSLNDPSPSDNPSAKTLGFANSNCVIIAPRLGRFVSPLGGVLYEILAQKELDVAEQTTATHQPSSYGSLSFSVQSVNNLRTNNNNNGLAVRSTDLPKRLLTYLTGATPVTGSPIVLK